MGNQTSTKVFHIIAFSTNTENQPQLSILFFIMYVVGTLGNLIIITVVSMDIHLHTPMYLFLGNLSCVDIGFSTVILPKVIYILLTGNNAISFIQCFTQTYFCIFLAGTEGILLSSMAYDRYVAICNPLHYQLIMNNRKCILLIIGSWISGAINSVFVTGLVSELPFCHSSNIPQFYCDVNALAKIACTNTTFLAVLFAETLVFGFLPLLLSLISYIKIISSILHVKSTESRGKAFSTCSSHLTVLTLFYGTILCTYLRSPTQQPGVIDQAFSVLYTGVTPMLNPLIYSLRNKEVKSALVRLMPLKIK